MKHIDGNFKGVRNVNIYYQGWLPEEHEKAVLLVVHGLGEHSGRYLNVVNHFVPLGYAVYGLDHIGHGKSEGVPECVEQFADFTDTLTIFYGMVTEWQENKPIFILGHSMGGLITSYYLLDHQADFNGAIISAPAIQVGDSVSQATIMMGKVLSRLAPKMGLLALDVNGISRDPKVVEAYINDPLVFHGKTPARLAAELLSAMLRVTAEARLRYHLLSYRVPKTALLTHPAHECCMTKPAPKTRLSRSTTSCITRCSTSQNANAFFKM